MAFRRLPFGRQAVARPTAVSSKSGAIGAISAKTVRTTVMLLDELLCEAAAQPLQHIHLDTLKALRAECYTLLREAVKDIEVAESHGCTVVSPAEGKDASSRDLWKNECVFCGHICYLSTVVCRCNPAQVACAWHADQLSPRDATSRELLVWRSPEMLHSQARKLDDEIVQRCANI